MSLTRQTTTHPLREEPVPRRQLLEHIDPEADGFRSRLSPPLLLRPTSQGGASRERASLFLGHLLEEGATTGSSGFESSKPTKSDGSRVLPLRHSGGSYHAPSGYSLVDMPVAIPAYS